MSGWLFVIISLFCLVSKLFDLTQSDIPLNPRSTISHPLVSESKHSTRRVKNLTEVGIGIQEDTSMSSFNRFSLPEKLANTFIWTGAPESFATAHSFLPRQQPSNITREYSRSSRKYGGCFVKRSEGYNLTKLFRSPPTTCKRNGLCHISATFTIPPWSATVLRSHCHFERSWSWQHFTLLFRSRIQTRPPNRQLR